MEQRDHSYDEILNARPPKGKTDAGEIEIIPPFDADEEHEKEHGPYGVLLRTPFFTVVHDPVRFPNMKRGGYYRIIQGEPDQKIYAGVLLPMRPNSDGDMDIGWVRQWRHATQAWHTELPRGIFKMKERPVAGALRELRSETGLREPDLMIRMGDMAPDTGLVSTVCSYYATVHLGHARMVQREKDESEMISNVIWAPLSQWRSVVRMPPEDGRPVGPLDQFTGGAFGLGYLTGYVPAIRRACAHLYDREIEHEEKVAQPIRDRALKGANTFDVRLVCRSSALAMHFFKELPKLPERAEVRGEQIDARGITALELSWFSISPHVTAIEELAE